MAANCWWLSLSKLIVLLYCFDGCDCCWLDLSKLILLWYLCFLGMPFGWGNMMKGVTLLILVQLWTEMGEMMTTDFLIQPRPSLLLCWSGKLLKVEDYLMWITECFYLFNTCFTLALLGWWFCECCRREEATSWFPKSNPSPFVYVHLLSVSRDRFLLFPKGPSYQFVHAGLWSS